MFQHPDAQALYRSILAAPDDDAPRLILADWLDENGDETQAEYIRLACAAAANPYADATYDNRLHVRALRTELGRRWNYERPRVDGVTWGHDERGFCTAAKISTARSLELRGDPIRAATPVTHFTFTKRKPIDNLATWPGLEHVRSLDVERPQHAFSYSSMQRVLQSTFMQELHRYHVHPQPEANDILRLLVDAPACAAMRELTITVPRNDAPTFSLTHLSAANSWHTLTTLRYFNDTTETAEVEAFCASPVSRPLKHLTITGPCSAPQVQLLLSSPNLRSLRSLRLHLADSDAFVALLHAPHTANLMELDVGSSMLNFAELEALANCANLRNLRVLHLGEPLDPIRWRWLHYLHYEEDELLSLLNSPHLGQLRHLSLGAWMLSERIVCGLLESPALQRLQSLGVNIDWDSLSKDLTDKLRSRWHCDASSHLLGGQQYV